MSSYLPRQKHTSSRPVPKRISLASSARLSNILDRPSTSPTSPDASPHTPETSELHPDEHSSSSQPPPIPPQSPLRPQNQIAPTTPSRSSPPNSNSTTTTTSSRTPSRRRSSAASQRNRSGFTPTTLGDAPREAEEDEKPPPYSATSTPPPGHTSPNSPTSPTHPANRAGAGQRGLNGERAGNAWGDSVAVLAPKPTLQAHPAHRKSGFSFGSGSGASEGWFSKRGGKWRILLIVLAIVVAVGVALGVALGVTLSKKKSNAAGTGAGQSEGETKGFPVGNWTIPVVLQSVDTSCTSNTATFTCFPGTTVAQDKSRAAFAFYWVISSSSASAKEVNDSLTLVSGGNTFSLNFPATPLRLVNQGAGDERYVFSMQLVKEVQPQPTVADDGARTVCRYPEAVLSGALYTRGGAGGAGVWPGTAYVSHSSPVGDGSQCSRASDNSQVPVAPGAGGCGCGWVTGNGTATR